MRLHEDDREPFDALPPDQIRELAEPVRQHGLQPRLELPRDPQAWRVVDGKLYLNYSLEVQKIWEQDIPGNIKKADATWPSVLGK